MPARPRSPTRRSDAIWIMVTSLFISILIGLAVGVLLVFSVLLVLGVIR